MAPRSLRVRLMFTFGLAALGLSVLFGSLSYVSLRGLLVTNAVKLDLRESYVNAALIRSTVSSSLNKLPSLVSSIETATGSSIVVVTHGQWLNVSTSTSRSAVPASLSRLVDQGRPGRITYNYHGHPYFVVGIPIPSVETKVYEVFALDNLEGQLQRAATLLALGAGLTSLIGIIGGLWFARRSVRPLERTAIAASAVAAGAIGTRLPVGVGDREVQTLTTSFNTMVDQLVTRLERDARFASDVSHELRSPLTTLSAAASVIQRHRDELNPDAQASLDLLVADLAIFQQLVEDLLEMARADAGGDVMLLEEVNAIELIRRCVESAVRRLGLALVPIILSDDVHSPVVVADRRRFERVISNLLDNAQRYAHGATAVRVTQSDRFLAISVDDAGAGVVDVERDAVFDRFFRGGVAHQRGAARGTGLGLALVREHLRAIGATIHVTSSPEGGARFEIVMPLVEDRS